MWAFYEQKLHLGYEVCHSGRLHININPRGHLMHIETFTEASIFVFLHQKNSRRSWDWSRVNAEVIAENISSFESKGSFTANPDNSDLAYCKGHRDRWTKTHSGLHVDLLQHLFPIPSQYHYSRQGYIWLQFLRRMIMGKAKEKNASRGRNRTLASWSRRLSDFSILTWPKWFGFGEVCMVLVQPKNLSRASFAFNHRCH